MITLYGFGPNLDVPSDASAFVLKVDCYLRAAGIEYEAKTGFDNMKRAPKGKLPYISVDGTIIPDSAFIIDYLKETYGDPLDQELNAEQKALAHAFVKMMDENLYWCVVWSRWIDEQGWSRAKNDFFGNMPFPMKVLLPVVARKNVKKALHYQGIGRHFRNEILEIARKDLTALSDLLGNKDYFLINKVTSFDVFAYAHLCQLILPTYKSDFNDLAKSFTNLVGFVERIKNKYYKDE